MNNHPHMIVVSQDVSALKRFNEELKKKITDFLKRLLGVKRLNLWPDASSISEILDLEKAIRHHAYIFLNPCRADLEESIDQYPGESSWNAFVTASPSVNAYVEVDAPWVKLPTIPKLSRWNPSKHEEDRVTNSMTEASQGKHTVKVYPFAWLRPFGITAPQKIEEIRQRIIAEVRESEAQLHSERLAKARPVKGRQQLEQQAFMCSHIPKKRERRIFFLSSCRELRIEFLRTYRHFCSRCRECYEAACRGARDILWPDGAFIPPLRPLANPFR
jgi:hypothetical protein